jgi:hypothetical protein
MKIYKNSASDTLNREITGNLNCRFYAPGIDPQGGNNNYYEPFSINYKIYHTLCILNFPQKKISQAVPSGTIKIFVENTSILPNTNVPIIPFQVIVNNVIQTGHLLYNSQTRIFTITPHADLNENHEEFSGYNNGFIDNIIVLNS